MQIKPKGFEKMNIVIRQFFWKENINENFQTFGLGSRMKRKNVRYFILFFPDLNECFLGGKFI